MGKVMILGTANAVPDEEHENTHLLIVENEHVILVDCASNPIQHLRRAGVQFDQVTDMILSHFHPDHVSGAPLLLMGMWLMGRTKPLHIYGLEHTIDRMEIMMNLFDWKRWPDFYPVYFHRIPEQEMSLVIDCPDLKIYGSLVKHMIPAMGLRVEFIQHDKVVAYSCDTEPCDQVARLADKADALIHEAAGPGLGHSGPGEAGQVAQKAHAQALYLIHYPAEKSKRDWLLGEARQNFDGKVILSQDFMTIDFERSKD
jgi:ribonuclease Z